jgi:hypothetical protein
MPRRFHDPDDDHPVRVVDDGRGSAGFLTVLLLVGVFGVGLGGVGIVGLLLMRAERLDEADRTREAREQAQAAATFAPDAPPVETPVWDPCPVPLPPAAEGPPADLGPDREPDKDGKWTILFRSADPAYWDTTGNARHYAVPVRKAPAGTCFLRLKHLGLNDVRIIPITAAQIKLSPSDEGGTGQWNGTNALEQGARHLGIPEGGEGLVGITVEALGATPGSGFGHKRNKEGMGQRYIWRGEEILDNVLEIAVTDQPLTEDEKRTVVGADPIEPDPFDPLRPIDP